MGLSKIEIKELEVKLLNEAIYKLYGYDFSSYKVKTLIRRYDEYVRKNKLESISEIIPKIIHNKNSFFELLLNLSVTVTNIFRDPTHFLEIRKKVIPFLKTYPYINIWCAGCATGEEAYSIAIMLEEEGLLERTQIYATDINTESLEIAKKGIYSLENIQIFSRNYDLAGGAKTLSDYHTAKYKSFKIKERLRDKILFSRHNLALDGAFAEMHLIFCRNVMIYFDTNLQTKVLNLFDKSLIHSGFIFLGEHEFLQSNEIESRFEILSKTASIYKKTVK